MSSNDKEDYSFERKKKLADKISDMRDKNILRKIKDIILTENPDIGVKKTSNGLFMYFQNYTEETYHKIEKLLHKIEREKLERQTRSIAETSEQLLQSSEAIDDTMDYNVTRSRLRYSNKEARLIRRSQYEQVVHQKNNPVREDKDVDEPQPKPQTKPQPKPQPKPQTKPQTNKNKDEPDTKKTKNNKKNDTIFSKGNI